MSFDTSTRVVLEDAHEIQVATYRRDGSLRRWTPIWIVRAGDGVYVRSAYGSAGGWYRWAATAGRARVRAGGREFDVTLHPTDDPATGAAVDEGYRTKYRGSGTALDTMLAAPAAATTTRLEPAAT